MAGSKLTWVNSCWRSWALTAQRFAAWRAKGAVDTAQGGEPVAVVPAEVVVQALVGVDAQELPDAFDGQDLAVGQGRLGAALAQPPPTQPVIDQAVHGDEQRRSIHG
jgi:hypothetical protein